MQHSTDILNIIINYLPPHYIKNFYIQHNLNFRHQLTYNTKCIWIPSDNFNIIFTNLIYVCYDKNEFSHIKRHIKHFTISYNQLNIIQQCENLQYLTLNATTHHSDTSITNLPKLQQLKMEYYNNITIINLPNLKKLALFNCAQTNITKCYKLKTIIANTFNNIMYSHWNKIRHIHFSHTNSPFPSTCHKLKTLSIRIFNNFDVNILASCNNLKRIKLDSIVNITNLHKLTLCPTLTHLELYSSMNFNEKLSFVSQCPKLAFLKLNDNKWLNLHFMPMCPNITHLHLSRCGSTFQNVESLKSFQCINLTSMLGTTFS